MSTSLPAFPAPLPYHTAVAEVLQQQHPEIWDWFRNRYVDQTFHDAVHMELLKSTLPAERTEHEDVFQLTERVCELLGLSTPVSIHVSSGGDGPLANIAVEPTESHLVLHKDFETRLDAAERLVVVANRLSQALFYQLESARYLVTFQALDVLSDEPKATDVVVLTAQRFRLAMDIFCDRGALNAARLAKVDNPLTTCLGALFKLDGRGEDMSPTDCLEQATALFGDSDETPANDQPKIPHQPTMIRAWAISQWNDSKSSLEKRLTDLIQGPWSVSSLDLVSQQRTRDFTRELINAVLSPEWMRTEKCLALARCYFDDYTVSDGDVTSVSRFQGTNSQDSVARYTCFVLLDFVTACRDRREGAIAHALVVADGLGIKQIFSETCRKELRLRKKQLAEIESTRDEIFRQMQQTRENDFRV